MPTIAHQTGRPHIRRPELDPGSSVRPECFQGPVPTTLVGVKPAPAPPPRPPRQSYPPPRMNHPQPLPRLTPEEVKRRKRLSREAARRKELQAGAPKLPSGRPRAKLGGRPPCPEGCAPPPHINNTRKDGSKFYQCQECGHRWRGPAPKRR